MTTDYEQVRLECTGGPDMVFQGRLLASHDGSGSGVNRWHDIALYVTSDERYTVSISYRTLWEGELDHHAAYSATDEAGVIDALRQYDPVAMVRGYPPGEQYAEKQRRLMEDLRRRYAAAVSDVLREADITASPDSQSPREQALHLRRYRDLLARALAGITLTRGEAALICDVLNGTALLAQDYMFIPAEIEESIRLNHTDEKWDVDGSALVSQLRSASPTTLCAIADAAERFWEHPSRETDQQLREVGLLREAN